MGYLFFCISIICNEAKLFHTWSINFFVFSSRHKRKIQHQKKKYDELYYAEAAQLLFILSFFL